MATAKDVAQWMVEQLNLKKTLYQEDVVIRIGKEFGKEHVYNNENGNPAISKAVLKEFKKLTPNAVWERGERCWRFKRKQDSSSRQQD